MIKFTLQCAKGHAFDSWFASGKDHERLEGAGLIACAVCGSNEVRKSLMAPQVTKTTAGPLRGPASVAEQAVVELRRKVEATAENVGKKFTQTARDIHYGDAPERPIYGEANLKDARELIDEGIAVMPLPWADRKTN